MIFFRKRLVFKSTKPAAPPVSVAFAGGVLLYLRDVLHFGSTFLLSTSH